jgi:serine/threonine-protein kinase
MHYRLAEVPELRQRFFQEARLLSRIRHPHVVEVRDHGTLSDGRPYLILELLRGVSLRERLGRPDRLTTADTFAMFLQLADALGAVHAHGIVHRDLKPENVVLVEDGSGGTPLAKLIDFGIAKVLYGRCTSLPTLRSAQGALFGSPAYMTPEQVRGATVDHRADLYALGLMMYEIFTDSWPWPVDATDMWAQLAAHAERPPRQNIRLQQLCRPLAQLVMRCLSKDPAERPQSAAELRAHLEAAHKVWALPPPLGPSRISGIHLVAPARAWQEGGRR